MAPLDYADTPAEILEPLRARAMALPEVVEDKSAYALRWMIRRRTYATVITTVSERGENTFLQFRSSGEEFNVLSRMGHPFFRAGWGENVLGMVLTADTDWDEVGELITESFCIMAPKKLAAAVQPPLD